MYDDRSMYEYGHKSRLSSRAGVSLMEMVLFTSLACVVGIASMYVYRRGTVITDETQQAILVQQDMRAIVEYFTRDMNAAHMVWDTGGQRDRSIRLVKYASEHTDDRIRFNVEAQGRVDYPFPRINEFVHNRTYSYLVTYTYDPANETVIRREETGTFTQSSGTRDRYRAVEFSWAQEAITMNDRVLGSNVKEFSLDYFGYEGTPGAAAGMGLLKRVDDLDHVDGYSDEVRFSHTACVLLRVTARYDEGVYVDGGAYRAPEVELVTKVWSHPRLRDEMYREYSSSMGWDLRF